MTVSGHSPHGECGLKYVHRGLELGRDGHSPHGECGLKSVHPFAVEPLRGRHSPHGECGLKYVRESRLQGARYVTPRMGSAG